jgi:hypothetical protein
VDRRPVGVTIKNLLILLATPSAPPVATPDGAEYLSDFSASADDPVAFESDFSGAPVGDAYRSDFAVTGLRVGAGYGSLYGSYYGDTGTREEQGSYQVSGSIEVYGRFRLTDGGSPLGLHQMGEDLIVLRDGYGSDFALWADPQGPVGFDDVAYRSGFSIPRHVAETYPPPLAFSSDFSDEGFSYFSQMDADTHIMDTGNTVPGRFRLNSDTFVLSGVPLKSPLPFYVEQMLPGTPADDRLGHLILGQTVLGGDPA